MPATALLSIVDRFRERSQMSDAALAARIGITRQALHLWRQQGLRALPAQDTLDRLATVTNTPYRKVLGAALIDTGYLSAGQTVSFDLADYPSDSSDIVITGDQLRDLFREDFSAWTETPVAIYDSRGQFVARGPITGIALAVPEDPTEPPVPFYGFESTGEHHRWSGTDRCTLCGPHPPIPEHMSGGRAGTQVTVSELRIGDCVTAWRGNGLRVMRLVGLSPAVDEWGDVRLHFVDTDSRESITHPNMRYADTYTKV